MYTVREGEKIQQRIARDIYEELKDREIKKIRKTRIWLK